MREHIQTLPNDQLSQFSFSVEVFNRARVDDHELKIDGKMYDIVRVKTEGNQVHVFAMHDASEDSLLGFLDATLKRLEADATQPPGSIMYFTLLAYTPVQIDFQFSSPLISKIIFSEFTLDTPGITLPIDSPPPKI